MDERDVKSPGEWYVETAYDGQHHVRAARMEINGGALVFFDYGGAVSAAYGQGYWKSVA